MADAREALERMEAEIARSDPRFVSKEVRDLVGYARASIDERDRLQAEVDRLREWISDETECLCCGFGKCSRCRALDYNA